MLVGVLISIMISIVVGVTVGALRMKVLKQTGRIRGNLSRVCDMAISSQAATKVVGVCRDYGVGALKGYDIVRHSLETGREQLQLDSIDSGVNKHGERDGKRTDGHVRFIRRTGVCLYSRHPARCRRLDRGTNLSMLRFSI